MQSRYITLFLTMLVASAVAGCGSKPNLSSTDGTDRYGTVSMSLTRTVGDRTYRLTGSLPVYYHAPEGATLVETLDLGAVASSTLVHSLREGMYDFELASFQMFASEDGAESEVTTRTTLTSAARVIDVAIVEGQPALITFAFDVAGVVVVFDPCDPNPQVAACPTGDADADGIPNGVECMSGDEATCADSDTDGTPDYLDTDSDNDLYLDSAPLEVERTNPCVPNAYATACTHFGTGQVEVEIDVAETCSATPPDTCDFVEGNSPSPNAWHSLTTSQYHSCAIRGDGSLDCWGYNATGQLGTGTTMTQLAPAQVGTDTDWQSLASGQNHVCGIRASGSLYCWGGNAYGQLGDGTTTNRLTPTGVGTDTDWARVGAGRYHTCAIKTNGALYCWGYNTFGQLGDGTTADKLTPIQIGTDTNWLTIDGMFHTCATKTNGELYCWGYNTYGTVGDGTNVGKTAPTRVGTDSSWVRVETGFYHTCATKSDGSIHCWGSNGDGQLGTGNNDDANVPTQIDSATDWVKVTAGDYHTCGLKVDGALYCWGSNAYGKLGDGTETYTNAPIPIDAGNRWKDVVGARDGSCAIRADDTVYCWGRGVFGTVGDGTGADRSTPTAVTFN